jgi:integrase
MNEFKQVLRRLPPNRNKLKQYRDKSIAQLVRMNVKKSLSERTINKHLTRIGTLFDYAITNGFYNGPNPAFKMSLKLNQSEGESRAAYTPDELERLFRSEKYLTDTHLQPYQFWTPVIALFTGMRQNEIAQLYLGDIREEDGEGRGVWYFDLNKDGQGKKLKNKNAKRQVPIHNFLLEDLKFLEYVNHLKAKGEIRLFPEINPDRDGYGGPVSKWFNERYKTKCGIIFGDRQKDFHSFRATFISALEDKVPFRMLQQCAGHSRGKSTTITYIEQYSPKRL